EPARQAGLQRLSQAFVPQLGEFGRRLPALGVGVGDLLRYCLNRSIYFVDFRGAFSLKKSGLLSLPRGGLGCFPLGLEPLAGVLMLDACLVEARRQATELSLEPGQIRVRSGSSAALLRDLQCDLSEFIRDLPKTLAHAGDRLGDSDML